MAIDGLNHVNIRAPAELLPAVRDFYVEILGLVDGERGGFGRKGYWLYAGGQAIIHLGQLAEGDERVLSAEHSPVDHIALSCSDLAGTEQHLQALDTPYRRNDMSERGMVQLFVEDPTGLRVELNFSV